MPRITRIAAHNVMIPQVIQSGDPELPRFDDAPIVSLSLLALPLRIEPGRFP